jgi:uncharacterized membrane protein YdjX (TVP38/TMEM64 family)
MLAATLLGLAGCQDITSETQSVIHGIHAWIEGFGVWGMLVFALVYILATLALIPGAPLSIVAGLAYGLWGLPLVVLAALAGSSLAFQLARTFAHGRVHAWTRRHPRGGALVAAVRDQGWKIVLLLRLSPVVPFNVQNYLFGITGISFSQYAAATAVGILPGAALFISIGAFGHGTSDDSSRMVNWVLFGIGLAATVLAVALVTRKALARLDAARD